jgi:DNA-directed RNA polymerase specialized sigma24 family protein
MLRDTSFGDIWTTEEDMKVLPVIHAVQGETVRLLDGRFVGLDGFVCPTDITEFVDRYPDYVKAYAYKLMHRRLHGIQYDMETFDDVASELMLHLINLSPGRFQYKDGKRDYVQCFDPIRQHGAKKGQFFNYINMVLMNRFSGYVYDKLTSDPTLNGFRLEWSDSSDESAPTQESAQVITVVQNGINPEREMANQLDAQTLLRRVLGLVKEKDRVNVKRVLEAAMVYDKNTEIALALGMKKEEVNRTLKKVRKVCEDEGVYA